MFKNIQPLFAAGAVIAISTTAVAQTPTYFVPLTESAAVTEPNSDEELNAPWIAPAGVTWTDLTSMSEIEGDPMQSVVRAPGARTSASMWDMVAYDDDADYIFIPHETPNTAGVSRYDIDADENVVLFSGDGNGATGDWSNDFAAFDPSTFTPNGTVMAGEEWSGEGRIMEILNPFADPADIQVRELESIANVAHEGLRFSRNGKTLYFVDEWNSGAIYKFVSKKKGDYTVGQTFVLSVDNFDGVAEDMWNDESNADAKRTGIATWIPLTNKNGVPKTDVDPFRNGPTNDPRTNDDTRGGRPAADEVGATPFGRPEDMEIGRLANGNEVMYFCATSERTIYSVEMVGKKKAIVRVAASDATTRKNGGFAATTAEMNSPDNLAQDTFGNIYIIEDAPNGSSTGGDIWFMRDIDNNGMAESIDHFLSLRVAGSESTGMIWNPQNPTEFVVAVQHPASTNLDEVPNGYGDALWQFDVSGTYFSDFLKKKKGKKNKGK